MLCCNESKAALLTRMNEGEAAVQWEHRARAVAPQVPPKYITVIGACTRPRTPS